MLEMTYAEAGMKTRNKSLALYIVWNVVAEEMWGEEAWLCEKDCLGNYLLMCDHNPCLRIAKIAG